MPKGKTLKQANARTTTIHVVPEDNFAELKRGFQLVRYVLPEAFAFTKAKSKEGKFARLHNELKESINYPYRVFTHDKLDGRDRWAAYVLYPQSVFKQNNDVVPEIKFEGQVMPARKVSFTEPPFHIVIKLLQILYFRSENDRNKNRFVGQDKCYIYAKRRDESDKYHVCLEIELKGDLHSEETFYVYSHARTFMREDRFDPTYVNSNIYFTFNKVAGDVALFNQVKRSHVAETKPLYKQQSFEGDRTTLDYHSGDEVEQSRGYLVDAFMRGFTQHLTNYGFHVAHIERKFQEHPESETSEFILPVELLKTVYVHDVRFNRQYDLEPYIEAFQKQFPSVSFEIIEQVKPDFDKPVLVFEDCSGKAFKENMPLFGETDPHTALYEECTLVPKQFINLNETILDKSMSIDDYISYEPATLGKERVKVAMYQLFLKNLVLRQQSVEQCLPLSSDLMFVHKETRKRDGIKTEYEVALYFEADIAHFVDVLADYDAFANLVQERYGLSWDDGYEAMLKWRKKDKDEDVVNSYDVIIGEGLFIEIVDANETLLYEYEKIIQRHEELKYRFDIEQLKLSQHYDEVKGEQRIEKQKLYRLGLIDDMPPPLREPRTKLERESVELFNNLQKYDKYLDSLKPKYFEGLSFRDLINDEEIAIKISDWFGSDRVLRNLYKNIGMFRGVRESDVIPVYQGIWHTDEHRYVVGDTNGMNETQARAHRVRQFKIYMGAEKFEIGPLLEAMSVKFVRLNQYTVMPYYFHLIDQYIGNLLVYQRRNLI